MTQIGTGIIFSNVHVSETWYYFVNLDLSYTNGSTLVSAILYHTNKTTYARTTILVIFKEKELDSNHSHGFRVVYLKKANMRFGSRTWDLD